MAMLNLILLVLITFILIIGLFFLFFFSYYREDLRIRKECEDEKRINNG